MLITRENGSIKLFADTYTLEIAPDRPFVYLEDLEANRVTDLFVLSSINPTNSRDDTVQVHGWEVEEGLEQVVFSLSASSSIWEKKVYRFRCHARRFLYEVDVYGSGDISEVNYLGGFYSGQIRWGSGFFWSGQRFELGFNPEPTCDETYTFHPDSSGTINLTGVPLPGRGDWFFTPVPFSFSFKKSSRWMSMSVESRPGENLYHEFGYHGTRSAFYLSLQYDGHAPVNGKYELPSIAFEFGEDPYLLLARHVHHLRQASLVPERSGTPRPDWWSEPIFCGWGAQCYLSASQGGKAQNYATQASYTAFVETLSRNGVFPGTVVIDDKWQEAYGTNLVDQDKWPDLAGFIRQCHSSGQKVLLWLKAWDPEGVPDQECIRNAAGLSISVDPTNPAYEQRLRESIRLLISDEGYGADGFKIDFSARIPTGPGAQVYGREWGLELMRRYLWILHDEATRIKPDALILAHTPHPYLADLVGMIRLNDINTQHDICRQMTHRARIAAIACPDALIDMDNWPCSDRETWRAYLEIKPLLGVPSLYYSSHIDSTREPLREQDYASIRSTWAEYRADLDARRKHHLQEKRAMPYQTSQAETLPAFKRLSNDHSPVVVTKPLKSWVPTAPDDLN